METSGPTDDVGRRGRPHLLFPVRDVLGVDPHLLGEELAVELGAAQPLQALDPPRVLGRECDRGVDVLALRRVGRRLMQRSAQPFLPSGRL